MKKRTITIVASVLLVFLLVLTLSSALIPVVFAQSDQEIIRDAQQKKLEAQQKLDQTNQQKAQVSTVKKDLDVRVNQIGAEVEQLNQQIASVEDDINQLNHEIDQAQNRIDVQDELLRKRICVMYEEGSLSMLEILVGAKSFSDFLHRLEAIKTIAEYDNNLLSSYEQAKKDVVEKKELVLVRKQDLEAVKGQQVLKQSELEGEQAKLQQEIDRLNANASEQEAAIRAAELAEAQANQRILMALGGSANSAPYGNGTVSWPFTQNYVITSEFSNRISPITGKWESHKGIDIGAPFGTTVLAAADGRVVVSEFNTGGYGYYVVIDHGGGISTLYAHHSVNLVSAGVMVRKGDPIARVGSTGYSTGPHLHFEVRINGVAQNPFSYLQ